MDYHGNSTPYKSQIDGSLVQIHSKFPDYSMSFIHAVTWHGFWTRTLQYINLHTPCKKCGLDSHLNFVPFHITNRRQFGWFRNWHQIPWLFHVIHPGFIRFPCKNMTWIMDYGQIQVMEFPWHLPRKWWDFHRISSHFRPNYHQKDMRKSVSHFLLGIYTYIPNTKLSDYVL